MKTTSSNINLPIPDHATVIRLPTKGGRITKKAFRQALSFRQNRLVEQVKRMDTLKNGNQQLYPQIYEQYQDKKRSLSEDLALTIINHVFPSAHVILQI